MSTCIKKECDAPWCNSQLDQLNSQYGKTFSQSLQKLTHFFSNINNPEFNIQMELVELKKLFHKLRDIFGKKIFIENHLPTASKKLRTLNDSIEKGFLQLVQVVGKICSILEDKNSMDNVYTIFVDKKYSETNGRKMTILEKQTSLLEESKVKLNEYKSKLMDYKKQEEVYQEELNKLKKDLAEKDCKVENLETKIAVLEKQMEVLKTSTMETNELRSRMIKGKSMDDFSVLEFYFCEEINKAVSELENVKGTVARYRKDVSFSDRKVLSFTPANFRSTI